MHRALDRLDAVEPLLTRCPFGVISDYDGTLAPIVDDPTRALISSRCRAALERISRRISLVAILSGRSAADVARLVGVEEAVYLGNHGLEQWHRGRHKRRPEAERIAPAMREVYHEMRSLDIHGIYVEDKGLGIAVHYRGADDPAAARARIAQRMGPLAQDLGLRMTEGKMVVEARPQSHIDKGEALRSLVREYALASAIFLGDDLTDVDAFHALHNLVQEGRAGGLAVAVVGDETPRAVADGADLALADVGEVATFLEWLADRIEQDSQPAP